MTDVCRSIELGRHGSIPEVKTEWEPAPILYFRTSSIVVSAEVCAPNDLLDQVWEGIQDCSRNALGAATLTALATGPAAAIPVFTASFKTCAVAKLGEVAQKIKVSISSVQKANEDWHR